MVNKVELNELTQVVHNEKNFLTALNENLVRIQKAINDTLSRSGVIPNQMEEVLDMNGKRIINVGDPVEDHDALTRNFIDGLISRVEEAINRLSTLTIEARNALIAYANEYILPPAIAARDAAVAAAASASDSSSSAASSAAAAEAAKAVVEGLYEDLIWIVQHKTELLSLIEHAEAMETVAGSIEDIQDIADNLQSVLNSKTWAEGTDEEVQAIGGTHSSKRWAEIAQQATQDLEEFTGATATADGTKGLVKKPVAGQQNKFLRGDGTWADAGANYTAGTGIDITGNTISVKSPVLQNTATGTKALTVGGTATANAYATNVGVDSVVGYASTGVGTNAIASGAGGITLGANTVANKINAIAIGYSAQATANGALMLGYGNNTEEKTFKVALTSTATKATSEATGLYTLLQADGKIPENRIVKQTTLSSASTDNQVPSAKCVYDLVGNVEALINAL